MATQLRDDVNKRYERAKKRRTSGQTAGYTGPLYARVCSERLRAGIRAVLHSTAPADDTSRPVLNGVALQARGAHLDIATADGWHLTHCRIPIRNEAGELPPVPCEIVLSKADAELLADVAPGHRDVTILWPAPALDATLYTDGARVSTAVNITFEEHADPVYGRGKKGEERRQQWNDGLLGALTSTRFPDWSRIVPDPNTSTAVVRMQARELLAIIPCVADYTQIAFIPEGLQWAFIVADDHGDGHGPAKWYELAGAKALTIVNPITGKPVCENGRPLAIVKPEDVARFDRSKVYPALMVNAKHLRSFIESRAKRDTLAVHYWDEKRPMLITYAAEHSGELVEYMFMPMTLGNK